MKDKKQLAKIAYLYYIEGKSQSEISEELGIYRTTISRLLKIAKEEGIVKIEINEFDTELFYLENYIKEKYNLKSIEIISVADEDSERELSKKIAQRAANIIRELLTNNSKVGISWGKTLSDVVEMMSPRVMKDIHFYPLAGGPSRINAQYHVNTLVYKMARKFQGECSFVNATVVQESVELARGIVNSKYFEEIRNSWENLDLAIVGVGGKVEESNKQWLDMLSEEDFKKIEESNIVGEICCRLLTNKSRDKIKDLDERTISISLESLKKIDNSVAVAYGKEKSTAILEALKKGYINRLITDYTTIINVLELDNDYKFSQK